MGVGGVGGRDMVEVAGGGRGGSEECEKENPTYQGFQFKDPMRSDLFSSAAPPPPPPPPPPLPSLSPRNCQLIIIARVRSTHARGTGHCEQAMDILYLYIYLTLWSRLALCQVKARAMVVTASAMN